MHRHQALKLYVWQQQQHIHTSKRQSSSSSIYTHQRDRAAAAAAYTHIKETEQQQRQRQHIHTSKRQSSSSSSIYTHQRDRAAAPTSKPHPFICPMDPFAPPPAPTCGSLATHLNDLIINHHQRLVGDRPEPTSHCHGVDPIHDSSRGSAKDANDWPCVLLTNDDGIDAPGLRAMAEALLHTNACHVLVCAPNCNKSGVGHSITLRKALEVRSVNDISIKGGATADAYEIAGTPADCVSLALSGLLFPQKKPTLVLSGINKGSNCGYHVFYSGTVAGAREAFIGGVPAMALSFDWKNGESSNSDFKTVAGICLPLITAVLRDLRRGIFPTGFFFNVDVPTNPSENKGFKVTKQGTSRLASQWIAVSPYSRVLSEGPLHKENAIGIQLAQLGKAASAVGATRQMNSPYKTTEIESVAESSNSNKPPSYSQEARHFRNQYAEVEIGDESIEYDFGALHAGYVTLTPLGLSTHSEAELFRRAVNWVSASLEFSATSSL